MEYTFIEVPPFTTHRESCFEGDEDFRRFQLDLMDLPDRWPVIQGAGPLRKARWGDARSGKGWDGGCRVIYLQVPEARTIFLLHVYPKNRKDDLSRNEAAYLAKLAKVLREAVLSKQKGAKP